MFFICCLLFFVFVYVANFVFCICICILFFVIKFKIKAFFRFLNFENKNTTNNIQRLAAYTRLHPLTLTCIYTFFKVT